MKRNMDVDFVINIGKDEKGLENLVNILVRKFKVKDIKVRESAIIDVASNERVMEIYQLHCSSNVFILAALRMMYFKTVIIKDGIKHIM